MASGEVRSFGSDVKSILICLEENLKLACEQISGSPMSNENPDFNKDAFWTNFTGNVKLISHEATKFCMMFEKEPLPSHVELNVMADRFDRTCLSLMSILNTFPRCKGHMLYKEISNYVFCVLKSMKDLCIAAKNGSSTTLRNAGTVWENCEAVENLPRDNKAAVLALCQQEHDLVQDASHELIDALENEDEPAMDLTFITPRNGLRIPPVSTWTDSDLNVILPCSGMVKAAKACLKKTFLAITERGNADDDDCCRELDAVAYIVKTSSMLIDDFVLTLYPPVNHSAVRHHASLVRNNFKELLSKVTICHFCSEEDNTWVQFLEKAVDHNWVRINDLALAD